MSLYYYSQTSSSIIISAFFHKILSHAINSLFITAAQLLEEKLDLAIGVIGSGIDGYLESPVSDGTIEENFEEALVDAPVIENGWFNFTLFFLTKHEVCAVLSNTTHQQESVVISIFIFSFTRLKLENIALNNIGLVINTFFSFEIFNSTD